MIVCFQCSHGTKNLLDDLVSSGQYKDYSEVISLALDNLNVLHNELSSRASLVIDSEKVSDIVYAHPIGAKNLDQSKTDKRSQKAETRKGGPLSSPSPKNIPAKVPTIFLLDDLKPPPSFTKPPADIWVARQEVPLERWIFGQYNKLLPAKASCRALAHLLNNKPNGIPLEDAASRIAEEALFLGSFLAHHDKQHGTKRDYALSTAFPSPSREAEKSRLRYASQFVASVNKQGQVSGLLMDLKLINHTSSSKPRLKLTEAGWKFVELRNPILDKDITETPERLSTEEKSFLLNHISGSVPAEDFAYRSILNAVDNGASNPEKLDSALQRYVSGDKDFTKSFLASQRSGAVSRMADLGLVTRARDGVKVSYVLTNLGKQYTQDKVVPLQRRKHIE